MSNSNRRHFLARSGALTGAALASTLKPERVLGANERVNIASIGIRSMGMSDTNDLINTDRTNIVALCDVDSKILDEKLAQVADKQGSRPKGYSDYRDVMENKDVDAVVIATPDHWHAHIALLACESGKDVYVEKPCAHNVLECQLIADAARKHNRVVQHGTQQRSGKHFQEAKAYVREGNIGKVACVKNWAILSRGGIGKKPAVAPPDHIDYDMWLGPAPKHAYTDNRCHYNWRFMWDYGTGDMGNWGVHWLDIALWTMELGWPDAVSSTGGMFIYDDDKETPDTQYTLYEYPDLTVTWELLMWGRRGNEGGRTTGTGFYGDEGTLVVDRGGFVVFDKDGKEVVKEVKSHNNMGLDHKHDFLDAIKNRTKPIADIETAHISAAVAIMGNVAYLADEKIRFDAETRSLKDKSKNNLLTRDYRSPWGKPVV